MTTTPTSGAADLRATFSEMLVDLPNTEPFTLFKAGFDAALAAGQATAAQAAAPKNLWLGALDIRMAQGRGLKGDRIPVLYTDTINGDGVCRDDLWLCTSEALKPAEPVAEPADTVVLNAAMRAIQQAIGLIGAPTDERMRAVRRVLRGAVIVAEDDGKVAPLPSTAYAALPAPNYPKSGGFPGTFAEAQMRAFADATCALRASHGQALRLLTQKEKDSLGRRAEGMDGNEWDQWVQEKFAQVNGLRVQGGSYEWD